MGGGPLRTDDANSPRRDGAGRRDPAFEQLFAANPLPMWVYDVATLAFLAVNDAAVHQYGYTRDEFLAMTLEDIRPAEDLARLRAAVAQSPPGLEQSAEWRHRRKNGELIEVEITSHPYDVNGRAARLVLAYDVTERNRAMGALQESEARFRLLAENARDLVYRYELQPARRFTYVSAAATAITGYTPEEHYADPDLGLRLVHPDDRPILASLAAGDGSSDRPLVIRWVRKDGSVIWTEQRTRPIHDASGTLVALEGIARDITDRREMEAALRESEDRFRDMVEHSHDLMCTHDLEGRLLSINPWAAERLGVPAAALVGRNIRDILHEEFRRQFDDYLARVIREGVAEGVVTASTARGERLALEYRNTLRTEGVSTPVVRGFAHDVTDRYRQERATRRHLEELEQARGALTAANDALLRAVAERELLTAAIEQSGEAVVITDATGMVEYVNPAFTAGSGYARDEIVGQSPRVLKSGVQPAEVYADLWATITAGRTWRGRLVNRRKDGQSYTEDAAISPVRDAAGQIRHYVAVKRDITAQLALEAQFLQAQKMESVGRLAGGVAHDFNNLLTVITGTVDIALSQLRDDDPIRPEFAQIGAAATRAAALTRQLLAFSRKQTLKPEVLDVGALISRFSHMLRRLIGEHITLSVRAAGGPATVVADPGQLEQVLLNLVVNARDAMPGGGTLTIELDAAHVTTHDVPADVPIPPGPYVKLVVADTGEGMDAATRARIFEPFFTTKEHGKGTGLGLSTAYGIVKQSGGFLLVDSAPGAGSRFTILLPRAAQAASAEVAHLAPAADRASETILVVEDEPAVRRIATRMLEAAGYRVLTAEDGAEALAKAALHEGPLDLVVTDLVMPGMSGDVLAARLAAVRPSLRVVFMSGHADASVPRAWLADNATRILAKPFTADSLTRLVRGALDA